MLKITLLLIIILLTGKYVQSQIPAYNLTAKNFTLNSPDNNVLEWDINLEVTGNGPMEYAGGQYFFTFNPGIFPCSLPPNPFSDTTNMRYRIIASDLASTMQPRNPQIGTATSPTAIVLRLAVNTFPGAGNGPIMAQGSPGIKIVRMQLRSKCGSFNNVPLNLAWRNPPIGSFSTKVFAYVGTANTDITTPQTHTIDQTINPGPGLSLNYPLNNSTNHPLTINFSWYPYFIPAIYTLQISTDSLFSNLTYKDSSIVDTFMTVAGLDFSTQYYWKVSAKDSMGFTAQSTTWNFTTMPHPPAIIIKLSIIPEGLYFHLLNQMLRKDAIFAYLRNTVSPYNVIDSAKEVIDSVSFTNKFYFNNAPSGNYYIQVKHLNSVETWSRNGGESLIQGDTTIYDFTTSSAKAYGNNLKLKGSKYCIYTGDVNQDGWVDAKDLAQLDNDAYDYLSGRFLQSDLNGDNLVDGVDFLIGDNNWRYVHSISPLNQSLRAVKP